MLVLFSSPSPRVTYSTGLKSTWSAMERFLRKSNKNGESALKERRDFEECILNILNEDFTIGSGLGIFVTPFSRLK